ncbi:hypothetical protein BCR35DRAFT_107786 [Leucosporidium creatinivorum]|uniref:Rho-GAP domain-containing protein n=1 Tax=Leucosporidium creatinivorum TaxID=106004 RepID=A0A1Y2G5P9_9BASI|nr:hypothetical protein BCR35DRAFT_107786 [Leucosporidium creatinivorum]
MNDDANVLLSRELDHHLAFFKRRHEIEVEYVESLRKLVNKDPHADDRSLLPPSWRKTSSLVRAETSEETMAHSLRARELDYLVKKLTTLKDDKDRMRRRVKEDSRTTRDAHVDYIAVVERLKRNYERKVEDVQAHEREEQEREREHEKEGSGSGSWPPEHWSGSESSGKGVVDGGNRPRKGSSASSRGDGDSPPMAHGSPPLPAPVFVSGAGSTGTQAHSAYRDPPTGKANVFEAIAKRDWTSDKHRINSLARAVGNLAKGGDANAGGVGLGGGKSHPPRAVRARAAGSKLKREAEQADRDYRDGVWRLETLRLQRARVAAAARTFLIDFAGELSFALKDVLEVHASSLYNVGNAMLKNGETVKKGAHDLNPELEATDFARSLRAHAPEPRVYYKNYFVGECRDLLFGVSLTDYHATHPDLLVPLIVQHCIAFIDAHGIANEGIYRISGKQSTVQQLVHQIERNEKDFRFEDREDPATVAGLLKLYLRQLPFSLFPFPTADRLAFSADIMKDFEPTIASLARRLRRLAVPNQATLKALVEHLARVVEHEPTNKMTAANLGVIFAPVVFQEEEVATIESAKNSAKDLVMEVLISQHATLFEGLPADLAAGRLSRAPSGSASRALSPARHQTPPFEQQVQQQILKIQQASLQEQQQQQQQQQHVPLQAPLQQLQPLPQPLPPHQLPPNDDRPRLQPSSSADIYDINAARPANSSDPPQPPTSTGAPPPSLLSSPTGS